MIHRFRPAIRRLIASVLHGPAHTPPELRQAVEAHAARGGADRRDDADLPPELRRYVETITRHAYRITDQDIDRLTAAGYSEDDLYEITISAALGAGLVRLERGLSILREER